MGKLLQNLLQNHHREMMTSLVLCQVRAMSIEFGRASFSGGVGGSLSLQ